MDSDHDSNVQQLDKQTADTPKITADSASRNVQGEHPVSVPASMLERPAPHHCVTCRRPCTEQQWFVPSGGWACSREHIQ